MGFLTGVGNFVLDFILNKALTAAWGFIKLSRKKKGNHTKTTKESDRVNTVREQIDLLLESGEPVSEEMWVELKEATYILNSNFY